MQYSYMTHVIYLLDALRRYMYITLPAFFLLNHYFNAHFTSHILPAMNNGDTIHHFYDGLEYQLQFEDHRMLQTVEAPSSNGKFSFSVPLILTLK